MMALIKRSEKGFTLIELLIVVAILGILAAVVIPNVGRFLGAGTQESQDTEFQNVITAVSSMMVDNSIASLPNPVNGVVAADTDCTGSGTRDMTTFPDLTSVVAVDKLLDPSGVAYVEGVDPLGDKAGFILFSHDIVAGDDQVALVNYMSVGSTAFCYETTGDGTITQWDLAGTQTNP